MALQKRILANILEISSFKFIGREGDLVEKTKYVFITPDQTIMTGYLDQPREEWIGKEIDSDVFVESKAVETKWHGKIWEGETKYRLI